MIAVDDNRHGEEFRLRILTTNACNRKCSYCLNDFQGPAAPPEFVDVRAACTAMELYIDQCKTVDAEPIITFAGGEPGLHFGLPTLFKYARSQMEAVAGRGQLVVVTNGTACSLIGITLPGAMLRPDLPVKTRFHIHVPVQDKGHTARHLSAVSRFATGFRDSVVFQTVVGSHTSANALEKLAWYCADNGIPLKLFSDFYEPNHNVQELIDVALDGMVGLDLRTRFLGVQQNRGKACQGCNERCITLKGVWMYPSGELKICPQGREFTVPWKPYTPKWFAWAYDMHLLQTKEDKQ